MLKRYRRIDCLSQRKRDLMAEKRKKRRDECLLNFSKLAEAREKQEREEEERRLEVLRQRESKEMRAERLRCMQYEQRIELTEQRKIRMLEVKRNLSAIRTREASMEFANESRKQRGRS